MATTKAQQRATNKYQRAHYDRINLLVPKGQRDAFRAHAQESGESLNGFIMRAIREAIERDNQTRKQHSPEE